MIWLTWRQFRAQALTLLVLLAAATIYYVVTGLQMHHANAVNLATCGAQNDCGNVVSDFRGHYAAAFDLSQLLLLIVPGLIGIFWGAPLIGRELETGTHQLAWNQSVTRTRWLAVKLLGVGLVALATAGLLSVLLTWWAGPIDPISGTRFSAMTFATRDITPLGYALFAFTLGVTAGLLLRRTIPAMAVTLAVFIGIQILVPTTIRPNLLSSTTTTVTINEATMQQANGIYGHGGNSGAFYISGLNTPVGAWILSTTPVETAAGRWESMTAVSNCLPRPDAGASTTADSPFTVFGACVASDDLHESVTYQPASHYWPLQWMETGLFLVLSAVLSGFCFWFIRRRQN